MAQPTTQLAWERAIDDGQVAQPAHPERAAWSAHLCGLIDTHYDAFIGAEDIKVVIPNFRSLNRDQRVTKIAELFARVAEYESSWDPASTAPDVAGGTSPDELATGLYQLNVADQTAYHTNTAYTAAELKDPLNNIAAGIGIALHLIDTKHRFTFIRGQHTGFFFETLLFDALYLTVDRILPAVWRLKV
jgi:hypothetical protein